MFKLTCIEDDIRVQPSDLSLPPLEAVTAVIENRFIDKVLPGLGLVITIYDVDSIEGGFVYPSDGAAFFKVRFRLVVFRPFVGEILVGRLKSCSREGLRVSLGFTEDVIIPEYALQDPSFYDEGEKLWLWKFEGNNMYMDIGEEIRLKVSSLRFNKPPTPLDLVNASEDEKRIGTAAKPFSPFEVIGRIDDSGLGLLCWWQSQEEGDDDA
ncbi:hypothetical protein CEUSTIGMA_g10722.t1 [Chlamydomonas eustigma]|uniref:RNA polymerase III subunit Rpc25 domain-containing protein n=1 Tax=Chlamydomonas eustigma TaxID=1157962 RepID=A0A250XJV4_9CHLO|nr:hypothetical protein CEUSTIGMA_g10722.t1 [Chlamydomonas eustigma]|eukprot:GAX83296.1 hypothetical protein CEUSTIGMA_g10722.t1 [Chlamydomonas eustigma]